MTVRDPMHFAANPEASFGFYNWKPQSVLPALRLTVLFTALADYHCAHAVRIRRTDGRTMFGCLILSRFHLSGVRPKGHRYPA